MMTRGISRAEAVRVLVEGYFEEVVQRLDDPGLEELVRRRIAEKLAGAEDQVREFIGERARGGLMGAVADKPLVDVRADFPVLAREIDGQPARLPRLGRHRRRSREQVIEAMDRFYRESYAPIHRGVYELAREATDAFEGARDAHRRVRELGPDLLDLHAQRDRGDQPRRLRVGPRATSGAGDEVLITRDGAPLEHRALAARSARRPARSCATSTVTDVARAVARRARRGARRGAREARGRRARVERARHDQPGRRDRAPRARAAGAVIADRRLAGGAADAGGPGRDRRRLLRLDRPQGARPDRSACCTAGASCSRRCGPFLGGGHMISRVEREHSTWNELPWKFEAGHVGGRRGGRARRGDRLPRRDRHGARARARARAHRLRAGAAARGRGHHAVRAARPRPPRRRGARSRSRACTRTTSPSCATARRSACAPATTARSR